MPFYPREPVNYLFERSVGVYVGMGSEVVVMGILLGNCFLVVRIVFAQRFNIHSLD
jgi:hypothetical protein